MKIVIKSCRKGYKISKFCKLLKSELNLNYKESYFILSDILAEKEVILDVVNSEEILSLLNEFGFNAAIIPVASEKPVK